MLKVIVVKYFYRKKVILGYIILLMNLLSINMKV